MSNPDRTTTEPMRWAVIKSDLCFSVEQIDPESLRVEFGTNHSLVRGKRESQSAFQNKIRVIIRAQSKCNNLM
jgi:hypothetical protein